MICNRCEQYIPENSRSKTFVNYCRHCAGTIKLAKNLVIGEDWTDNNG